MTYTYRMICMSYLAALLGAACTSEPRPKAKAAPSCPPAGRSEAKVIEGSKVLLTGDKAVGGEGDYLIRSDRAAFVISGLGPQITYYPYGGILVDAVPTAKCVQTADEQFEELGLMFGQLKVADFDASTLRAFRAESIEIINDGSNGKAAQVRVTGVDDFYWLVEMELIRRVFNNERHNASPSFKPLSKPYGVKAVVDYTLDPGSTVLQVKFTLENQTGQQQRFMAGPEMIMGDLLKATQFGKSTLGFGGFNMRTDIPFLTASGNHIAYAFAIQNARLSTTSISGVQANIDLNQVISKPLLLEPKGSDDMTLLFAVGTTDAHSANRSLQPYLTVPIPSWKYDLVPFGGKIIDRASGDPVSGATVDVQLLSNEGEWQAFDQFISLADGTFGPDLADFGVKGMTYRVVANAPGRNAHELVEFKLPAPKDLVVKLLPAGKLSYAMKDGTGVDLPVKINLWQGGARTHQFFVWGAGEEPVAPGTYEVSVTRGWEYSPYQGWITVPENGAATLAVTLDRIIDTSGYISVDTHVHSAPSPDSNVPIDMRIRTAAAEGLEVPVSTDHEIIIGIQSGIDNTGLGDWVATVGGEEFTATTPEHVTIFPVTNDGSLRGNPPTWYQRGLEEMFEAAYGRGASVALLNHPRWGCSFLCLIEWDRLTGEPGLQSMQGLGLPATSSVWAWNFHGLELMNGPRTPFTVPGIEEQTGLFDDWQAFLNLGHRMAAMGSSDEHEYDWLGMTRNYVGVVQDDPALFHPENLVDAVVKGDTQISSGAFARVKIGSSGMGDLVFDTDGTVTLSVKIEAIPEIDVTHFRIYLNCDEVANVNATDVNGIVKYNGNIDITIPADKDANIAMAAFGANYLPRGLPQFDARNTPRVLTNAIYIDRNGNGVFDAPGGKACDYTID